MDGADHDSLSGVGAEELVLRIAGMALDGVGYPENH